MTEKLLFEKPIQRIICGDNLESLKGIADESVDLCYIDPPFFTNKHYEVIWGDGAEIRQFNDRWITSEKDSEEDPKRSSKDINVYLDFMQPRIEEIYRVLKPTGSFYLHCDYHADAHLRIMCDKIFDRDPINTIIWRRTTAKNGEYKKYPQSTDTILFYSKTDKYFFINEEYVKCKESFLKEWKYDEEKKQYYKTGSLCVGHGKRWDWRGTEAGWAYNLESLEGLLKEGKIKLDKEGRPMARGLLIFQDSLPECRIDNLWDDIPKIAGGSKEALGYPTQKPERLLERIITSSSKKGDVVLDCFCGCGTAIAVAKRLNRQFIGMDVSPTACRLIAKRLGMPINSIEGLPITKEEISELDGNEFQNFIIREFGGFSGKRGADGGIDGHLGKLLIQVKKFKAGRMHLDEFSGMLLREAKKEGVFIALEYSKDFRAEVARLKTENKVIVHYFDVQDIIDKKHYILVSKHVPKKGLEKYDGVKPEFKPEE